MSRFWLLALLALAAGTCIPTQAGINARLSLWVRSPILAATISFLVGTLVLAGYSLAARLPLPPLRAVVEQPWWIWTGGLLGAFFVAVTIHLAPRMGATNMLACLLAGQMLAALALDHFALLGYPQHLLTPGRAVGVLLLITGVLMIRIF
ncbi:MAG: DMT family transporter [Deltaproteobacteria bacterium]|nr:MAG: DMT family transporter [Deltaproteobacteria bacterium]